jgi:hypothetical protein
MQGNLMIVKYIRMASYAGSGLNADFFNSSTNDKFITERT